jgi:hypothetical protein
MNASNPDLQEGHGRSSGGVAEAQSAAIDPASCTKIVRTLYFS